MKNSKQHKIALVEWSQLIEDFLDNIGVSFEEFCSKMTGGWLFGYIEALKLSGADTVLFCFSARVAHPQKVQHGPTGALICILPASRLYRQIRSKILNPYASSVEEAVGEVKGFRRLAFSFLLKCSPYLATPLRVLLKEIKAQGCTVVLCQDYEHARFDICVLLGRLLGLPVFASFQGGNWQMNSYERLIRPLSLKACKGLIVASGEEQKRLQHAYGFPKHKMACIFNPINLSMWQGLSQAEARSRLHIMLQARVVVWHGRIDYHRKGLDVLLDAWEGIEESYPESLFQLWLVGTGTDAPKLAQRLKGSSVKKVTWINEYINDRKQLQTFLTAGDIYAFPSRNEGFPVAPVEAMACGLALVASDAPGIPEILNSQHGMAGLLVPRGDSVALKTALLQLLREKEKCATLGKQGKEHIEKNFSLQRVGQHLLKFLTHK